MSSSSSSPIVPQQVVSDITVNTDSSSPASTTINNAIRLIRTYSESAAALPISSSDDYEYHSAFTDFGPSMERHAEACKGIVDTFSRAMVSERRSRQRLSSAAGSGGEEGKCSVTNDALFGVIDTLFEDIDTVLDDLKGSTYRTDLQTQLNQANQSGLAEEGGAPKVASAFAPVAAGAAAIVVVPRPQLQFERAVDNTDVPHLPLLFSEPTGELRRAAVAHEHPHDALLREYPLNPRQLRHRAEEVSAPVDATPLHLVGTLEELDAMITELSAPAETTTTAPTADSKKKPASSTTKFDKYFDFSSTGIKDMFSGASFNTFVPKHREIALDLEHHDLHSFQGITCLCQVSTRTDDYLVDVIALRSHMYRMNRFLLNPKIVKVLHGCREDVRWFQKDFGCYIANIFDTGAALQAMRMPYSLAFAVDHFCQVKLDKKYQLADWRQRPLSAEMVKYARLDTHYLLYIHDRLTNNLIGFESKTAIGNVLLHVLEEGRRLCRLVYDMPRLDAKDGFREALGRSLVGMRPMQLEITRRVFNWRDGVARLDDESPLAVMHPASVIQLGLRCGQHAASADGSGVTIPASMVLGVVKPVSMSVRVHLSSLLEDIAAALKTSSALAAEASAEANSSSTHDARVNAASGAEEDRLGDSMSAARFVPTHCPQTGTLPSVSSSTKVASPLIAAASTTFVMPKKFVVIESSTTSTSSPAGKKKLAAGGKRGRVEELPSTTTSSSSATSFYRLLSQRIPPPSNLRTAAALQMSAAHHQRKPATVYEEPAEVVVPAAVARTTAVASSSSSAVPNPFGAAEDGDDAFVSIPPITAAEVAAEEETREEKKKKADERAEQKNKSGGAGGPPFTSIKQQYGGLGRDQRRKQKKN